jgi:hypothetical protein
MMRVSTNLACLGCRSSCWLRNSANWVLFLLYCCDNHLRRWWIFLIAAILVVVRYDLWLGVDLFDYLLVVCIRLLKFVVFILKWIENRFLFLNENLLLLELFMHLNHLCFSLFSPLSFFLILILNYLSLSWPLSCILNFSLIEIFDDL